MRLVHLTLSPVVYLRMKLRDRVAPRRAGRRRESLVKSSRYLSAVSCGLLAACTIAVPANAATALTPKDLTDERVSYARALSEVNEADAEAYRAKFGATAAQARRVLALQRQVPDVQPALTAALGSGLAQVYFDNKARQFVIAARPEGRSSKANVEATMRSLGLADAFRFVATQHTRRDMDDLSIKLNKEFADLFAERAVTISEREERLEVAVLRSSALKTATERVAAEQAQTAVPIELVDISSLNLDPQPTLVCARPNCDRGVGGIEFTIDGPTPWCTFGFYVGSSGTPYPLALTAGHCTIGRDWQSFFVRNPDGSLAGFGNQIPFLYYDGGGDAGLVENRSGRPMSGGYMNWPTNGYSQLEAYFSPEAMIGYILCRHGGRQIGLYQGDRCGYVTRHNATAAYPDVTVTGLIAVDSGVCAKSGDSGSPVTWANDEVAAGIISGVSDNADPNDPTCAPETYVEPIHRALQRLGIVIYGGPSG